MTPPETRYARSGDLRIAYQVVGTGPRRPRFRARLRLKFRPFLGNAGVGELLFAACTIFPTDPVRQAWYRPLPPDCRHRQSRRADGRCSGGHGRRWVSARSTVWGFRGRANEFVICRNLSTASNRHWCCTAPTRGILQRILPSASPAPIALPPAAAVPRLDHRQGKVWQRVPCNRLLVPDFPGGGVGAS